MSRPNLTGLGAIAALWALAAWLPALAGYHFGGPWGAATGALAATLVYVLFLLTPIRPGSWTDRALQ